ncbi:unnamed protein product [Mytilus coruscus]|uniref:Uncharacterized protein n=1 Tax=Mytilus coruscus TaxID=42192 RepID=A0A6J8ATN3_MYTCO|nr:unnamed protein product [Mytilus coruscus]
MFYSTHTILIQGRQKTGKWVQLEYALLSLVIGDILTNKAKGNNSGAEEDKQIKIVPDNLLIQDGDNEKLDRIRSEIKKVVNEKEEKQNDNQQHEPNVRIKKRWKDLYSLQNRNYSVPGSSIILGQIIPLFYSDRRLATEYEQKRHVMNNLIIEDCREIDISHVEYDNMKFLDYTDGIHLNSYGVRSLVRCMKRVLNPKLWVIINETEIDRNRVSKKWDKSYNNIYTQERQKANDYSREKGNFSRSRYDNFNLNKQEGSYHGQGQKSNLYNGQSKRLGPYYCQNHKSGYENHRGNEHFVDNSRNGTMNDRSYFESNIAP